MQADIMDNTYLEVLRSLVKNKLNFVVIGTYGLRLRSEKLKSLPIKDCDLALENTLTNINIFIETTINLGWKVQLWEQDVKEPLDYATLKNKYYLRAKKGEYIIDATYELYTISFETFLANSEIIQGVAVASIKDIINLKQKVGRPLDIESIKKIEMLLETKFL
jgi:predicted nucleotidyltransferase